MATALRVQSSLNVLKGPNPNAIPCRKFERRPHGTNDTPWGCGPRLLTPTVPELPQEPFETRQGTARPTSDVLSPWFLGDGPVIGHELTPVWHDHLPPSIHCQKHRIADSGTAIHHYMRHATSAIAKLCPRHTRPTASGRTSTTTETQAAATSAHHLSGQLSVAISGEVVRADGPELLA
jgi:hypothetical protein